MLGQAVVDMDFPDDQESAAKSFSRTKNRWHRLQTAKRDRF